MKKQNLIQQFSFVEILEGIREKTATLNASVLALLID